MTDQEKYPTLWQLACSPPENNGATEAFNIFAELAELRQQLDSYMKERAIVKYELGVTYQSTLNLAYISGRAERALDELKANQQLAAAPSVMKGAETSPTITGDDDSAPHQLPAKPTLGDA